MLRRHQGAGDANVEGFTCAGHAEVEIAFFGVSVIRLDKDEEGKEEKKEERQKWVVTYIPRSTKRSLSESPHHPVVLSGSLRAGGLRRSSSRVSESS
jgi:hypothetical protein